jgi:hypothetical protein
MKDTSTTLADLPFGCLGGADLRGSEGDLRRERLAEAEHPELGMRHRIFDVARLAPADERVIEVHPEVSFRAAPSTGRCRY